MSQEKLEVVNTLFESIIDVDVERLIGVMHPDCVVHEAESLPHGGEWHGPEGLAKLFGAFAAVLSLTIHKYEMFDIGDDRVVVRTDATFSSLGSGRTVDMPYTEIFRVRDGKIIDVDVFYKDAKVLHDLAAEGPAA